MSWNGLGYGVVIHDADKIDMKKTVLSLTLIAALMGGCSYSSELNRPVEIRL